MTSRIIISTIKTILLLIIAPLPTLFIVRAIQQYDALSTTQPATAKLFLYLYSVIAVLTFVLLRKLRETRIPTKIMNVSGQVTKSKWVERHVILEQIYENVRKLPSEKKEEYRQFMIESIKEFDLSTRNSTGVAEMNKEKIY